MKIYAIYNKCYPDDDLIAEATTEGKAIDFINVAKSDYDGILYYELSEPYTHYNPVDVWTGKELIQL